MNKGLTHVYTGNGKGKTTAAFGLCLRALGRGMRVLVVQFLKGGGKLSGEAGILESQEGAELLVFEDQRHPIFCKDGDCDIDALKRSINEGFALVCEMVNTGDYDMVVMDEINNCMREGWLDTDDVLRLIEERPEGVELVLTGRGCPGEVETAADYVTEMRMLKHPAESGVTARSGVEF